MAAAIRIIESNMAAPIKFPAPGCIVEYLEDNIIQTAFVLEESGGKLRLLMPSRREVKIASGRLLPWLGPVYPASTGREEAIRILKVHKFEREAVAGSIDPLEVWEFAHGEIRQADAAWFAELFENEPDVDTVAAYGRVLLECKTHFRFQPPEFLVLDAETVQKRQEEQRIKAEREALVAGGAAFLHMLWDLALKRKSLTAGELEEARAKERIPSTNVLDRIARLLFARVVNPETQEDAALWQLIGKGLPDVPHVPFQLLVAWGKLPQHYNFWLDRADYEAGDEWWLEYSGDVDMLAAAGKNAGSGDGEPPLCDLPFLSIDSPFTRDIDDAFHVEQRDNGWNLTIALACPAFCWPFGTSFDKKILHRGTSIYLPEKTMHMMPEILGTETYSLKQGENRLAFCLRTGIGASGEILSFEPFVARASLAANLSYEDAQAVLDGEADGGNSALPYASRLRQALALAKARESSRIANGAIIMQKPEPVIRLSDDGSDVVVDIELEKPFADAQLLVAEMMVLASAALADWAAQRNIPLVYRTQNVTVPREYAGIWSKPEDLARVIRALAPSILETEPRPHAALAVPKYAPVTSPLRRYTDLLNEAQIINYLAKGEPVWNKSELTAILDTLSPALDAASQVQRFRPRYWKLLYFRQHGDKEWWDGVITEENENIVTVSLPDKGLFVRGKRQLFDERACPGMKVALRLGKVNPLYNEIQIMEVVAAE